MSISRSTVNFWLDVNKPNQLQEEKFLQGSVFKDLKVSILKNNELQTLATTLKPIVSFVYRTSSGVLDKVFQLNPKNPDGTDNTEYKVSIADNTISIPAHIAMTDVAGTVALVVQIEDNGTFYTYSGNYVVDPNPAYKSIILTMLPDYDTKADRNLANVPAIANAAEGDMFYKKGGVLTAAPLKIDDLNRKLISLYDLQVPPKSIYFGRNVSIHENGGYLENHTLTLDKNYLMLDYENDPESGSKRPIVGERGAKEVKVEDQPVASATMNNVTLINFGSPAYDRQIQRVYFNFVNAVTNFKIALEVNGHIVADYPAGGWGVDDIKGYDLGQGVQAVPLEPFWTELTSYSIRVKLSADNEINMLGNGVIPYLAFDLNRITMKELAYRGEGGGTGSNTLLELTDTPDSYTGKAGYLVRIKNSEDGVEFDLPPDFALPDLSNVKAEDLKKKTVNAGMLQQDLEDVDLAKLKEKVVAAGANLITVGELHGDYNQGEAREIQLHNGLDLTVDTQNKVATISLSPDMGALPDEVARIKTNLATDDTVFSYRGTKAPNYSGGPYKQYYVNVTNASGGFAMKLPTDAPVNAIFTVRNSDKVNPFVLSVDAGTINNGANTYNIQENGLALFIKNSANNWNAIYGGYMANNLRQLVDLIKAQLPPDSGLTIDQIQAQLKDRLHLFSEIQTEFNDELHTFDAIEANMIAKGFSKGFSVGYGTLTTNIPPQNTNWITAFISPNAEVLIPATNQGMKYLGIYMPVYLASLVSDVNINQVEKEFTEQTLINNELEYKVLIVKDQIDTSTNNRMKIDFHNAGAISGVSFEDTKGVGFGPSLVKAPIKDIEINQRVQADGALAAELMIKPNLFEYSKSQGAVAVLESEVKALDGKDNIIPMIPKYTSVGIGYDKDKNSLIIQDVLNDDPNVTGGEDIVLAFCVKFKPYKVSNDCIIRIAFMDYTTGNYLTDENGERVAVQYSYTSGQLIQEKMVIETQVKAITYDNVVPIIYHTLPDEYIILEPGTAVLAQEVNPNKGDESFATELFRSYTGLHLVHEIRDYSQWMRLRDILVRPQAKVEVPANSSILMDDGFFLSSKFPFDYEITNDHLVFNSHNLDVSYFNFGKIGDAVDVFNLGGKSGTLTGVLSATLTDKDDAYVMYYAKWTGQGEPNLFIITDVQNGNEIVSSGWTIVARDQINEDAIAGDHTQSKALTFFNDPNATAFAVFIAPLLPQNPFGLQLKDFILATDNPFKKVLFTDVISTNELHLTNSPTWYETGLDISDAYRILSLRYTINSTPTKLPMGDYMKGKASIELIHMWTDNAGIKGETCYKALKDMSLKISETFRIHRGEQASGTETLTCYLKKLKPGTPLDSAYDPNNWDKLADTVQAHDIPDSVNDFIYVTFPEKEVLLKKGDVIMLEATASHDDGLYIQSNARNQYLVQITCENQELTSLLEKLIAETNEIRFMQDGKEVYGKMLEYDVTTGKLKVIDKA